MSSWAPEPLVAVSSTAAQAEDVVALGMILPVGGFLTLGVVIATVQYFMSKPKKNKEVAK